jgi:hypothetical protein
MMSEVDDSIAAEIIAMSKSDQALRACPRKEISDDEWVGNFHCIDVEHTARMKAIIEQIGWPNRSVVGNYAAHMAWLLVQHADNDHAFQVACLALMREQSEGEVSQTDIHYLEDRINVAEGLPQRYGTQIPGRSR